VKFEIALDIKPVTCVFLLFEFVRCVGRDFSSVTNSAISGSIHPLKKKKNSILLLLRVLTALAGRGE